MKRHPDASGNLILNEGDYGQDGSGLWHVRPPGQHLGCIPHHKVTEHKDGTITVVPSISLAASGQIVWHGHLIRGEFTECGKKTEGGQR